MIFQLKESFLNLAIPPEIGNLITEYVDWATICDWDPSYLDPRTGIPGVILARMDDVKARLESANQETGNFLEEPSAITIIHSSCWCHGNKKQRLQSATTCFCQRDIVVD